ncbi:ATP-binding cassette domain-containing protein [Nocardia goodfellowii]|uniref:ABC-2 type transport system ATP-binding protein n=1 Tax=Nocardia goodfellowii TaxID=882446 RepID=A0ABS4QCB1_9NOCA|nr:ATP-binding cassette domain-containing protein [Nocardia goodfellowii]MBP2189340.1 ABC-2 type transport system ATP-binding protein [Nocardia goodfellowii]
MTTTTPAFAVRGLSKRFAPGAVGELAAVENVSFTVDAGTTTALVGPARAGKSTILRILLGLLPPTSGTASVGRPGMAAGLGGGSPVGGVVVPRGLHPARSARDHLRVYAAAAGVSDERADEVLDIVGLTDFAPIRAGMLSPGQQTRLALAAALLADPPLLILDDPIEGLDPAERGWLQDFLKRHTKRGGTALLSSRGLAAVVPMADNVIVLNEGAIVYQGTPAKLRRSHPDRLVVTASTPVALATVLAARGYTDAVMRPDGKLAVAEATEAQIRDAAQAAKVRIDGITADLIHPDRVLASLTRPVRPASATMYVPAPNRVQPPPGGMPAHPQPHGIPR